MSGQVVVGVVGEVYGGGLVSGGLHGDQQDVVLAQFVSHRGHNILVNSFSNILAKWAGPFWYIKRHHRKTVLM